MDMKKITCEMCDSTELVKQGEFFVCQNCGCKYSVEDAKKLMVEVTDNKKLTNLYERARKSLEVDDLEHAAEYYKQILDENPKDWEAYFYSYLGERTSFTNAQAGAVAAKIANTVPTAYDMAIETDNPDDIPERFRTITNKTANRLAGIASTGASLLRQYEGGSIFTIKGKVQRDMYNNIRGTAVNTIANCVVAFDSFETKLEEIANRGLNIAYDLIRECLLTIRQTRYSIANWEFKPDDVSKEKVIKQELIQMYAMKIQELDPNFIVPQQQPPKASGGCYVATCVYGSYDCPQVWTLRRYRDNTLGSTWYGRLFIRTYYAISPTLVKWFGKTKWFKRLWKGKLDRMVARLQANGVESTPYEDKEW